MQPLMSKACLLSLSILLFSSHLAFGADQPVTVLVTYHSLSGNTEKMARGVVEGAKAVPGTRVFMKRVSEVTGEDLFAADALIVGSPVYFIGSSPPVKAGVRAASGVFRRLGILR